MNKYNKIVFVNGSAPPLNADNLNHMDEGIERATDGVTAVEEALKTATADLTTVKSEVETARGISSSLNARLNGIDSAVTNKAEKARSVSCQHECRRRKHLLQARRTQRM